MKHILKKTIFVAATLALGSISLTGCVEETFPLGSTATADQVEKSPSGLVALFNGPAAFLNKIQISTSNHYDWGYGSLMHIRDVMTGDMALGRGGHYYSLWAGNLATAPSTEPTAFPWYFTYKAVQTTNDLISAIGDPEKASDEELGMLAVGRAWRALFYLDAARMYEFLPCDVFPDGKNEKGNVVTGLTIPIITEGMTEAECRENPRATREQMFKFIKSDLDFALANINKLDYQLEGPNVPNVTTVLGLYARLYMWVAQDLEDNENLDNYQEAAKYAQLAIDASLNEPMTETESLHTSTGFNTPVSSWMLANVQNSTNETVLSGILNWTGWMSNEQTFGYALGAGITVMISSDLYNKITPGDFRALWFIAPEGSELSGKEPVVDPYFGYALPEYASLKFRPGQGNPSDFLIASSVAYPMMRIEEMYFIVAEALAHGNAQDGKDYLESFMQIYRNPDYTCAATRKEDVIREIIDQKSIEFFGEGLSFFDIKRLNYSVDRTLSTNYQSASQRFRTNGRPAWMNFCLMYNEEVNNAKVMDWNNPSPAGKYRSVTE